MRIQYLSDLHLEFHASAWRAFVDRIPVAADILVLSGDIAVGDAIPEALRAFSERWRHVVYVPGNHEYYGGSPDDMLRRWDEVDRLGNVHWLENTDVLIDGHRFLGTTLWFPEVRIPNVRNLVNDFVHIKNFEPWVYERNRVAQRFLEESVFPGDIVVTHYLPHPRCVHPKYKGSPLNPLFVCDMRYVIENEQPALWFHGHTHESVDIAVGETRIVCNPYGYHPDDTNPGWRADAVVEVG